MPGSLAGRLRAAGVGTPDAVDKALGRLDEGEGWKFVEDLLGLLGIVSDPG
jgi:hypothetical protein